MKYHRGKQIILNLPHVFENWGLDHTAFLDINIYHYKISAVCGFFYRMLLVLLKHSNKSKALMPGIVHIDLIIKNMYFLFTPICYRRRLKNCSAFVK